MRRNFLVLIVAVLLFAGIDFCAAEKPLVNPKIQAFPLGDVKLLPGLCKRRADVHRQYLNSIPNDSLLFPFYKEAVVRVPSGSRPLGGWEDMSVDVRGHYLGHYLSACARIYAATGDTEMKAKADQIVAELARCQQANGNGYAGPTPEKILTALENGRQSDVWAPYYVVHKVLMGLYEMYLYTGNEQALRVARGMADYVKARTDKLSDEVMTRSLEVEQGGMTEVLYDLYGATGADNYLKLAQRFEHHNFLDPLAANKDMLGKVHANTNIPKVYGATRAYELTGDKRSMDIAVNFWNMIVQAHSYATGGSNNGELWSEPNKLSQTLSRGNVETCTTYNMMWLTQYLFRWTGDPKYADYYERNLYNGIISIQNPTDGQFCYFTPMQAGSVKVWGTPLNSFWCCYGTATQAFASLASGIYFHDADSLYVSLFTPSEVSWRRAAGVVRLIQNTDYPEQASTRLTVRTPAPDTFGLKIRVPWWAKKGVEVKVNQAKVEVAAAPGTFLNLTRPWKDQDVVEVSFPMSLYAEPMPDDPSLMAIMYGPLVMAGLVFEDVSFTGDSRQLDSWIEPVRLKGGRALSPMLSLTEAGFLYPDGMNAYGEAKPERDPIPLILQTRAPNPPVKFIPLYRVTSQPYGIYFKVTP
jgi:hypothetical protein